MLCECFSVVHCFILIDLMLPGVVLKSSDPTELGLFSRGRITAVCLAGNRLLPFRALIVCMLAYMLTI